MDAEERLTTRARTGDAKAFDELLAVHDQAMRKFVGQRVDPAAVDDLVQEIELHAWRSVGTFNGDSSFPTWFCSIACHEISDCFKRRDRFTRATAELQWMANGSTAHSPASLCEKRELLRHCLRCVICSLALDQQVVLLLCEFMKESDRAAAKKIRKSVRAVQRLLREARLTLHRLCGGLCRVVSKTGIPEGFSNGYGAERLPASRWARFRLPPSHPPQSRSRRASRQQERLIELRDQLIRELLFYDSRQADQLIAESRNS